MQQKKARPTAISGGDNGILCATNPKKGVASNMAVSPYAKAFVDLNAARASPCSSNNPEMMKMPIKDTLWRLIAAAAIPGAGKDQPMIMAEMRPHGMKLVLTKEARCERKVGVGVEGCSGWPAAVVALTGDNDESLRG
jgi:hypothetical protein